MEYRTEDIIQMRTDIVLKLFISKSVGLDEKELAVLAILNGLYSNKQDYLTISIGGLAYNLSKRWIDARNKDRRLYNNIKSGIQSLADRKLIKILDQNGDNYIISNDGLEVNTDKEKFVVVELWEMQKIFSESNKPFNVFLFFVNLVGTINNQTKEWHMTQDDMAALWGASKRTVNDYLKQLEEMQLIYVYRHKKRRSNGTYYKLNNSYGRYCDKDAVIAEALKYSDTVECEDFVEKLDRRAIKLRYNAYCNDAKKYMNNFDAEVDLCRQCIAYNKSLKYKPVEGYYDGEYKQGELLDLSVFPDEVRKAVDGNLGEPVPMEHDFSIEEILDMPTEGEVLSEPIMANIGFAGQDDLCKDNHTTIGVQFKTGDYEEPDYIEADNLTSNIKIDEPKVSADKGQNTNNSDSADSESHGQIDQESFCVTKKDSDLIDIDDPY